MTPDARVQELLPCPHCGSEAVMAREDGSEWSFRIGCPRCFARTQWWGEATAARAAWNRRSTPETERLRSALRALANLADENLATDDLRAEMRVAIDHAFTILDTPTRDPR